MLLLSRHNVYALHKGMKCFPIIYLGNWEFLCLPSFFAYYTMYMIIDDDVMSLHNLKQCHKLLR